MDLFGGIEAGGAKLACGIGSGRDYLGEVRFETATPGECRWGAARSLTDFLYLTIGTGIGGGGMLDKCLMHGLVHPEMGHIFLPRHLCDNYAGRCPYHGSHCFESLVSGPAMAARWGRPGQKPDGLADNQIANPGGSLCDRQ